MRTPCLCQTRELGCKSAADSLSSSILGARIGPCSDITLVSQSKASRQATPRHGGFLHQLLFPQTRKRLKVEYLAAQTSAEVRMHTSDPGLQLTARFRRSVAPDRSV